MSGKVTDRRGGVNQLAEARTILVAGSHDWADSWRLAETLDRAATQAGGGVRLLVGDAPGADALARVWAGRHGVPVEIFEMPGNREAGKAEPDRVAGPEASRAMLDRLDQAAGERLVVAFDDHSPHLSPRTAHCTDEARRRGYPVALVTGVGRVTLPPRPAGGGRRRTLREAALGYAARGIPVLPLHTPQLRPQRSNHDPAVVAMRCSCGDAACDRPGKHPRTLLVPHGVVHATEDRKRIKEWWRRAPLANVGLATGHLVDVLDLDGPQGVTALRRFATHHSWAPTGPLVRTGRGWHLYLRPSGTGPRNPIDPALLPHVDWRGKGAYAIAPPSRHAFGAYTWVRGLDTPLAAAPAALHELLAARHSERTTPLAIRLVGMGHPYGQVALARECDELAAMAPNSGRNRRLFDAGLRLYSLVAGGVLDETQVEEALIRAAERCGLLATEGRATRLTLASARRIAMQHPRGVPERSARPHPPAQRPLASAERDGPGRTQGSTRPSQERR
jgi:hypothetical protein